MSQSQPDRNPLVSSTTPIVPPINDPINDLMIKNQMIEDQIEAPTAAPTRDSVAISPTQIEALPMKAHANADSDAYSDKTARLQAISQLIKNIQPIVWGIVLMVVLFPLTGKYLIDQSLTGRSNPAAIVQEIQRTVPDWSQVDGDIAAALQNAEQDAEAYASQSLDLWLEDLQPRVEQFLDWYFDFVNQKVMEFKTPFIWTYAQFRHHLDELQPEAQTAIVTHLSASFEKEFAKRVLVPRNAQLRLEAITNATIDRYLRGLETQLGSVQAKYHLPKGEWDRYLSDISLTLGEDGSLSNLSLKTLAGGGTYLAAKPFLLTTLGKLGSKTGAKVAGSATGKLAAKAGGGAIAEFGAAVLDPLVGIGIIAWDIWDYRYTVSVDRPILKENLTSYLNDMKQILLNQPETGVMSSIRELEKSIVTKLK